MKCFLSAPLKWAQGFLAPAAVVFGLAWTIPALGELPMWVRHVEAQSALEGVFFRLMALPGGGVLFRRPPRETRPALSGLIKTQPNSAELYTLRALEDEQQLDFTAAESDWKAYVDHSTNKAEAQLALADFYHRRLRPSDEIKTLSWVANAPPIPAERLVPTVQQRSWQAFERNFAIIQAQGLPKDASIAQYHAWLGRYPAEPSLYVRYLQFLVAQKEYAAAEQLIADYHKQFPNDQVFPVKGKAMVEYRQGSVREGLGVYEKSFQPLWDPELVQSYFDLLRDTQNLRNFLDQAQAALHANPEDLNAVARIFYYYQQQGKLDVAQQAITSFRLHKENSKSAWTAQELYVCARLLEDIHAHPESARYYFALYNTAGIPDAQAQAIGGLANLLLTAPETPIRIGSGDLSIYRDIATMDQGPGYLNGILSLILNTSSPGWRYSEEEQRAVPYFHRSRAAELLAMLDARFPSFSRRPELHAKLLEFYAGAGESDAVIAGGRSFLSNFPSAPQRTAMALLMADAYSRKNDVASEFAIYDSALKELAAQAQNVPLGAAAGSEPGFERAPVAASHMASENAQREDEGEGEGEESEAAQARPGPQRPGKQAFQVNTAPAASTQVGARSPEYARVLERYLARLVEMKQIPQALAVLRREIDRNPDDPGLYERLAVFLDQNRLGAEKEEVYRRAIARFPDRSWYHKLARFYLAQKRNAEFEQLTQEAVKTFAGSDLEGYFDSVGGGGSPALYLRLNQYANQRFPHSPVFVRNLLAAYTRKETRNDAAWESLLRQHWFEEADLRDMFFEYLSRTGKLDSELSALRQSAPDAATWESNPAAAKFLASAHLWQSHFEESAPILRSLASQYPADAEVAHSASSVYRSLAYFDPADTAIAARIEDNLSQANPTDTQILARTGDIYADRELFRQAAPYWERIPQVAPGQSAGYLDAATIYWDYFDFDNALRLLKEGRDRLANPSLYSYEAGAIYENKRDYPRAIDEYIQGAIAGAADSPAELRLLELARRPKLRDLVDQATAKVAAPPGPSMPAIYLRVKVFGAQNRKKEMEAFLDSIVSATTSIEQAEAIESLAQQKSLETVRQHALERQAALATDSVTRLQLRYALIRLYEGRKDYASAQNLVESLYRENPKILGVVRSTVDFYWSTKMYPQAISVLLQAAHDAYPELSAQFTFEAARKSTEAKQFQQARHLLTPLLKDSPYNGEYLAAMADTFAQAGDDRGLQQFYLDKIALFRNAPLPADARKAQLATLRRALIPPLTRMKNYSGAVDQYVELINNFPEDEALVTEAALYAQRYGRQQQLLDFYSKTVEQSPRDYRWSMVLARMQANLEQFPAAIDTYARAIAIRPDRADLYTARAGLEERLMRFDEAVSDYDHVYQLAYKDPQWIEKVAELRARQGKTDETVAALKAALIEGRPEAAGNYFEVARRLESWNMLDQARSFAEQGIQAAGPDLLAESEHHDGAKIYVRIMTRLRQYERACSVLLAALDGASSNLPVLKDQVAREGVAAVTDSQWRERGRQNRIETAGSGMAAALQQMGETVSAYFTPEERVAFAHFAESQHATMSPAAVQDFGLPWAESAGLADQQASWALELMMQQPGRFQEYRSRTNQFIDLQRRRLHLADLGPQLEKFANLLPVTERGVVWVSAADAYRSAGDPQNETRMLSAAAALSYLDQAHQQRLFELLLAQRPQDLVRAASLWSNPGQSAADYVVAHGDASLAQQLVDPRGGFRPPVWRKAYHALVGLYFADASPDVNRAFLSALGDRTIGERLAAPVDRSQELAGDIWFYYGSRYGEYLAASKQGASEDFLAAALEQSPATSGGYLTLADYYADTGDTQRAITDYNHTLELSPNRPDVYDRLAVACYKQGDRLTALAKWKMALATLSKQLDGPRVPESFWRDFGRTCDQLRARHLFSELKPDADALLRTYLRRNGNYRSNALLQPAYLAAGSSGAVTSWLLDLASSAPEPAVVLSDLIDAPWIPLAQRAPIYQRILTSKQDAVDKLSGLERDSAQQELRSWQIRWISYLVRMKQYPQAAEAAAALPKETRDAEASELVPLDLQIAARLGTLDTKIAGYRSDPTATPDSGLLRNTARQLFEAGDKQSARAILEFVFAREIDEHHLVAANFLGLAEIRIASGDMPGALDLLRRLVVVVGNPFENLEPSAALLEKTGHYAEGIEFLDQLVKSAPWEPSYRLRLAKAKLAAGQDVNAAQETLAAIAAGSSVPYALRLQAATALAGRTHTDLGSGELNLLAGNSVAIPVADADRSFYYEARMKAAETAPGPVEKIQLLSHCISDFPSRDDARVPLFRVAASIKADEFAVAVLEPLLRRQFLRGSDSDTSAAAQEEEQEIVSSGPSEEETHESTSGARLKLPPAQQAEVEQLIGDVMARLNRLADAECYFESAQHLEKSPPARVELGRKIASMKAMLRIQRLNLARQPILHEALEQDRVVRPRIVASAAPAATQGGVKP